jgi:DNA-binding transcriptional regulator of glucitol operon
MSSIIIFGALFAGLYIVQSIFSMIQIKSFNKEFQALRRKGKVVVGKKSGHFAAGSILLFLVSDDGLILEAIKMQGISVLARFKKFDKFNGLELLSLNPSHPLVKKQMKLTRKAIENGRELYIRFLAGAMEEEHYSAISPFGVNVSYAFGKLKNKFLSGKKGGQLY